MGNLCCNSTKKDSSEILTNEVPKYTEEKRISRNLRRISNPPNDILPTHTNYGDHKDIDSPNIIPGKSTDQKTNIKDRNSVTSPRVSVHMKQNGNQNSIKSEQNTNYKVSNKTPGGSNKEINIVDGSKPTAIIRKPTTVFENVSVSVKDSVSEPDYSYRGEKVKVNDIVDELINFSYVRCNRNVLYEKNSYELEKLDYNSQEYYQMAVLFYETNKNKHFFKIHSIEKVHNPYLALQYELNKIQLYEKNIQFKEVLMFHGTKKSNIDSICQKNFDWRLSGTSTGCKFGEGVSFSPIAYYATHYGDTTYNKVMIAAHVLVGECCEGYKNMLVPHLGCDTSVNSKKEVFVKFDDNTFYPAYLIHYRGIDEAALKKRSGKKF
ncbi:uncharacterized protein LOC130450073 [Diorhabda sublineata]|uniref:uncharacterized protein LOC130450073 n=1 Tax=Diorhabda sublineata TaxID=1163346 RepID=UPI0024E082F5|nr:uncharacterized protein LOC130450073 [Diorhabda sublineata]XP_056644228.1 uncharacterized protein LOC130450073 [Diorhabda sublineata]